MSAKHTPTPWAADHAGIFSAMTGRAVVRAGKPENRAFILLACNLHDELVERLRDMVNEFDEWEGPEEPETSDAAKARNHSVRVREAALATLAKVGK